MKECTRKGIIGVKDVDLLASVPVDVTRCHPNGVALAVPQGVERGALVVNGDVDESFLLLVVLEHEVRAVVAVNTHRESFLYRSRVRPARPEHSGYVASSAGELP